MSSPSEPVSESPTSICDFLDADDTVEAVGLGLIVDVDGGESHGSHECTWTLEDNFEARWSLRITTNAHRFMVQQEAVDDAATRHSWTFEDVTSTLDSTYDVHYEKIEGIVGDAVAIYDFQEVVVASNGFLYTITNGIDGDEFFSVPELIELARVAAPGMSRVPPLEVVPLETGRANITVRGDLSEELNWDLLPASGLYLGGVRPGFSIGFGSGGESYPGGVLLDPSADSGRLMTNGDLAEGSFETGPDRYLVVTLSLGTFLAGSRQDGECMVTLETATDDSFAGSLDCPNLVDSEGTAVALVVEFEAST